jgi:hypothetical protein
MDSLIIRKTEDAPEVILDTTTNHFIISGESRPENTGKFYAPVINWIVNYENILYWHKNEGTPNFKLAFTFKFDYFNSTSSKYILDIILILKDFVEKGYNVTIQWHYDKRDDDMLDAGKEFSDLSGLKFEFVGY